MPRRHSKEDRRARVEKKLAGTGVFLYENVTRGDLTLPKPTLGGKKVVKSKEQFQGDSYFMQFVKTSSPLLKLVKKIETKDNTMQNKLILDQPEKVTAEGTVEHVVASSPTQTLKDSNENAAKKEVLLTEDPLDGVEIICG